ncbi:MAG: flagellar motor switch protein FliN [Fuerstiella sp.]|nr:flagellar motor switch protein FliN [Fuerstiella sp.]
MNEPVKEEDIATTEVADGAETNAAADDAVDPASTVSAPDAEATEVHPAEFPEAVSRPNAKHSTLERFSDVQVDISVEIGRVTMGLGELLQLGEGSVVELNRDLNEPVSVMAQGVQIASGEVVVINDRFAVRVTEVASVDGLGSEELPTAAGAV